MRGQSSRHRGGDGAVTLFSCVCVCVCVCVCLDSLFAGAGGGWARRDERESARDGRTKLPTRTFWFGCYIGRIVTASRLAVTFLIFIYLLIFFFHRPIFEFSLVFSSLELAFGYCYVVAVFISREQRATLPPHSPYRRSLRSDSVQSALRCVLKWLPVATNRREQNKNETKKKFQKSRRNADSINDNRWARFALYSSDFCCRLCVQSSRCFRRCRMTLAPQVYRFWSQHYNNTAREMMSIFVCFFSSGFISIVGL